MKKILGYSILVVMFAAIFGGLAYFVGFKVALLSIGFASIIYGLTILAVYLIESDHSESKLPHNMSKEDDMVQTFIDKCYEGEITRRQLGTLCYNEGWCAAYKYYEKKEDENK